MRILFTFVGGRGHFEPLAPIARAARRAGHEVAFGCAPSAQALVAPAGLAAIPLGAVAGPVAPPRRSALQPLDAEREDRDLRERFARVAARVRVPWVVDACRDWRPDVLVRDETDFGASIAAEKLGLPRAAVVVIAAGGFVRAALLAPTLDALRAEHGLPPDPALASLSRDLVLAPFPPAYRDPTDPLPAGALAFRVQEPVPPLELRRALPDAPTLYFTLGTVFHLESGDLFARVLRGLAALPANVIATCGPHVDPAELGAQPAHVTLRGEIPQAAVLPLCDAVVSHGGSGSVLGALAHGLPSLLIPIGADQPHNARRCAQLGAARVLDALSLTPEGVREAVAALLGDPRHRRAAERVRDEIAALPGPEAAVAALERLAGSGPTRPHGARSPARRSGKPE